jgi:hypothetical protein
VGVAAAQYDYTPPQRAFNAVGGGGGGLSSPAKERPTYSLPGHTPGAPQGLSDLASAPPSGYSTPARPAVQQQVTSSQIFAPVQQQQQRQQSFAAPAAPLQQQRQEEEAYQSQTFRHVRRRLSHFPPSCTLAPSPTNCTIGC